MRNVIGETAGKVWAFLEQNGPASINKILNETGLARNDVQRGIGWLAREGKVEIEVQGRVEMVSLK